MPWHDCGNDWGAYYSHSKFDAMLSKYHNSGANVVRQWIHFDGHKQVSLYDEHGYFKPLDKKFLADAEDNLKLYKARGLKAIFTMFSFECANYNHCEWMLVADDKQKAYIDNGLKPLLNLFKKYKGQIYAIEMFNEPEWMINGGAGVKTKVSLSHVQNFTRACNHEITKAGFKATVGSASLKWQCKKGPGCVADYWGNVGQSFRTVHYYDWMVDHGMQWDPFSTRPSDWGFRDGEVLVGESPNHWENTHSHGKISVANQYYLAH